MKCVHLIAAFSLFVATAANATGTSQSLGIGLQDPSTDPSVEHMRIVLDRVTVKPGRLTLHAVNQSKSIVHEVLIARDDGAEGLPLDGNHDLVIEARIRLLGRIANVAPGETGNLTLTFEPGTYVLFCNLPGHYLDGMIVKFSVVP